MTPRSADSLVAEARARIDRVAPEALPEVLESGGLVVDIRPVAQRAAEGELPGAHIIERNVLEWRLDPTGEHRIPEVSGWEQPIVLVCSEGYASSLAAASLADMGFTCVGDLIGGFLAWNRRQQMTTGKERDRKVRESVADTG
jgi:rhodanese-related sulfurtransferase